jgi:two-component sensor histidine kinase
MALHELATNASKYGALSTDDGRVRIEWEGDGSVQDALFRMSWTERGGPQVEEPVQKGFGSRLIVEVTQLALHGKVSLDYESGGLTWRIEAPMENMLEHPASMDIAY